MFGGEDTSSIVIDVGACSTKIGFAGEYDPKTVFPSVCFCVLGFVNSVYFVVVHPCCIFFFFCTTCF